MRAVSVSGDLLFSCCTSSTLFPSIDPSGMPPSPYLLKFWQLLSCGKTAVSTALGGGRSLSNVGLFFVVFVLERIDMHAHAKVS